MNELLSIVVTARNDNHGGNLLHRIQLFINGIFRMAQKYELKIELIIVEWNPPADKMKLDRVLDWSRINNYCEVRIIEVPSEIHAMYENSERLHLHQMLGKNVGLRRANGDFVLATNVDILFSDELFEFLAKVPKSKGVIYRTDRFDIQNGLSPEATLDEQREYCLQNTTAHFAQYNDNLPEAMNFNACGDFQLMSKEDWMKLCGYSEFPIYPLHLDSMLQMKAAQMGIKEFFLQLPCAVYHIEHEMSWTPQNESMITGQMNSNQVPMLSMFEALQICNLTGRAPINDDRWGLHGYELKETNVHKRGAVVNYGQSHKFPMESRASVNFRQLLKLAKSEGDLSYWIHMLKSIKHGYSGSPVNYKTVVVFGTGTIYESNVKPALAFFGVTPVKIVDNDLNKQGRSIDDVIVESPLKLMNSKDQMIIVASARYSQIASQLTQLGFSEGQDFINSWVPFAVLAKKYFDKYAFE